MATVAVQMVLEKLAAILAKEAKLLGGVHEGVDELRKDLESMKSFLEDAEARSSNEEGVRTWVKQVRDVAYDTEDVLAEFLQLLSPPAGNGLFSSVRRGIRYVRTLRTRHRLGVEVQGIRLRMKAISERRRMFSIHSSSNDVLTSSNVIQTWHDPRMASLFMDEDDLVGIDNSKSMLIDWLVRGEEDLTIISVVGMGGVGKTTLVKQSYDSRAVKNYFDCHCWVTVSKSFAAIELLQQALKGFLEAAKEPVPEGIYRLTDLQLVSKVRNYLQEKRYVVVLDDIWSINAWESVKFAFPNCNCGSRVIFTTRVSDVLTGAENIGHVYELRPLPEKEAWTLFCKKAFRGEHMGVCPRELREMSESILKKCGGLPLAIVTIGGLLSKKNKVVQEWKKVHDSLGVEMRSNPSLKSLEEILLLSYKDLPYHLKCCFLYLSIFPENYLIKRMKLVRLWVVERFVEEKPGLTMEEVAEDYLHELVNRSMIQVVHLNYFDRVYSCRVHDLMREIIQSRSRDELFVTILNRNSLSLHEKVRRIALHDTFKDFPSATSFPSLRSLLMFLPSGSSLSIGSKFFYGFRLLQVLVLENAPLSQFPPAVSGMIHLRYLSLRRTMIRELPESIGKLKNLEMLDLKHSQVSSMPKGILRLENLIHLRNYRYHSELSRIFRQMSGTRVPAGIGKLTNLQKLGSVEVDDNGDLVKELGKLSHLRRLGILKLRREDGGHLCLSLEKMKHLTSLYMVSITSNEYLPLDSLTSPPQFLQRLCLKCRLPMMPKWIKSLESLAKLVLQYCHLNDDPLRDLQELPNLVVLELRDAYEGKEICCGATGYPRLKKLVLYHLSQLKNVEIEKGAMPRLMELIIVSCDELQSTPSGIEHLRDLQYLGLSEMPHRFLEKIEQAQGEDFWKVQHISTIRPVNLDLLPNKLPSSTILKSSPNQSI